MWVGEMFYPTPDDFLAEGLAVGISKRMGHIPRGFKIGEDMIMLAHNKCSFLEQQEDDTFKMYEAPGIFMAFRPSAIEYVVKDDDTDEYLLSLEKRGIRLVRVEQLGDDKQTKISFT
jgi:hypothetical protein